MGFEYVITRLKGLRARFLPDAAAEAITAGKDLRSVVITLEDSVFAGEMAKLRIGERGALSPASIARCVEEGRREMMMATATLMRRWLPAHAMVAFSRPELEQVKEAMRLIRQPVRDRRVRLLPLTPHSGWTARWAGFGSVARLKQELAKAGHPFAPGIDAAAPQAEAELLLEHFYFGAYLPRQKMAAGNAWDYFTDQHDILNWHTCRLAAGMEPDAARRRFVPGPGRMTPQQFQGLCAMGETALLGKAEKMLHRAIRYRPGLAGFAQALRQAYLTRWRLAAIREPMGLLAILVFLEEMDTMAANIKLAVFACAGQAPEGSAACFVHRSVA